MMPNEPKAPDVAGELERWANIQHDDKAIVACGERWKAVAAKIGCTLHGFDDGFTASFTTPDGNVIEVGVKFRAAITALANTDAMRAENEQLEMAYAATIAGLDAQRLAALAENVKLREALADLVPGKLCGESWNLPDDETVTITVTFGKLRTARSALTESPSHDHP